MNSFQWKRLHGVLKPYNNRLGKKQGMSRCREVNTCTSSQTLPVKRGRDPQREGRALKSFIKTEKNEANLHAEGTNLVNDDFKSHMSTPLHNV